MCKKIVCAMAVLTLFACASARGQVNPPVLHWAFDEGSGTTAGDSTGNGNTGTLYNGPQWVAGKFGNALQFDGSDDYVHCPSLSSTISGNMSISCWLNYTAGLTARRVIDLGGFQMRFLQGRVGWDNSGGPSAEVHSTNAYNDGQWHHVVFVRTGTNYQMFIDTVPDNTGSGTAPDYGWLYVGAQNGPKRYYTGIVDDVQAFNYALSQDDINELFQGGAPSDTDPPTPDPATFASPPAAISETEITMTATTGSDASPPVEYYFDEISGNPGGADRPWSTDPTYTNSGLQANTQYTYTVQMRDSLLNTGTASAPAGATTPDNTPPTPDPMDWATPPYSTGTTSIAMVASTASDISGVEYYFTCTSGGGNDSGWQDTTSYEDTGLSPGTQYCYTVQARDKSPNQNATASSAPPACATTDAIDTTAPSPDPMTWATPPYSTGTSSIAMVATTATDVSGVEYYFQCTSGGGNDSGWQDSTSYTDTGLSAATQYCYAVQARDKSVNQNATAWSSPAACATTDSVPTVTLLVDTGGCGPLQAGWVGLGACGTYTNVGGTGIDVTLATGDPAMCECRNPGATGTLADVEADLLFANDRQSAPDADFILTLTNLTPGAGYQLFSYHSRTDEGDTTIPNVTVTGATGVTKPSSIVQNSAIMDNPAEILFTAGAGDVVIRYEAPSGGCGGCQVFFNGFELYTTAPANPTIEFDYDSSSDLETVTPALIDVIVNNADAGQTYTVDYAVTGGTATGGGIDYTLANGTLTFVPGDTIETISIDIVDDGTPEPDETIIITLSNPTGAGAQLGSITDHTYTILDPTPSVEFDEAGSSGMETVTPVYVTVSLSAPATQTVTVDYDVTGGTATGGGVDYTLTPGTLTFNPNDVSRDITIDIVSDANDQEPAETIIIGLSNPTNANLGATTEYTYTIVSQMIHLKVDFAQVYCPDTGTIRAETAKPGWWHWATGRWADMYAHDCAWACEEFPCPGGIDGTGITAAVTLILEGDLGMKVAGLTGALGGGICPTGSPIYEPICNSWLQCIDWPEFEWGSIQLVLHDVPAGEYELYSYHNHFGCYREDPGEYTPVTCDCLCNPAPPMPVIRAMSCKEARELPYQSTDAWTKLFPGIDWTNGPWPEGVVSIQDACNVQPQQVTTDAELVPSLIKFSTDGSPVLILYKAGCCEPDPVRPTRVGGRAILNAFELVYVGGIGPDTNPPSPDPMTWATPPYSTGASSIAMVASTATDASGVEYYFQCTSGGGNDSGWQGSTSYEDTGLSPATQYCYQVQARDKSPNQNATAFSTPPACATTDALPDTTPPSPDPMTWTTPPYSTGTSSIAMVASTATDASGVEYYFQCTSGGGNDSGWQDNTSYSDTGLSPATQYCYAVQARDKSPNQNATGFSTPAACATTDALPDTTPPSPDPMTWETQPYATGPYSISMTATTATDASGVEYFFECTAGGGNNSAWQDSATYADTGLSPVTQYTYRVQARDKSPNQNATAFSGGASATTSQVTVALLRGAFHFRADSDPTARVGSHPDIMVRLGSGDDNLIFRRDQGYLPVWYAASYGEESLAEIVARSGCETTVNWYSRVRLIENNPARAIVHWRYAPDCGSIGLTAWVDEYFTVYPDGLCMRTVKNAAGTTFNQWQTAVPDIYALQLLDTGLDVVPASWLDNPALSVTSGSYTDDGYNAERRCYELQCNTTCSPTALSVTLDTTGGKLVHNPVLVLKNWGDADADVTVDSQPFSDCYIGYADRMYGDDLVVWLNIESSASIDISITPSGGSGQFVDRALPPAHSYNFADSPPLPLGSSDAGPFGAYYTNLPFNNKFDESYRVGEHADVVVQFDDSTHRFVFWRGTNYQPHWAGDSSETPENPHVSEGVGIAGLPYTCWYGTQFVERRGEDWGLPRYLEPMSDWECRYAHVRIISTNAARAIVQWRYAPCHLDYQCNNTVDDPWGDWVNEYYTIYPDGMSVRSVTAWSRDTGGADMESPHIEFHEAMPITNPGTVPEDNIHWNAVSATDYSGSSYDWVAQDVDGGAMTNLNEITNRPIMVVRMKGSTVPLTVVEGTWVEHDPVDQHDCRPFNHYDDWPAWPDEDRSFKAGPELAWLWDEDPDTHCYRYFWEQYPAHCSMFHMKWDDYEHVEDVRRVKIMLFGMVDATEAANVNNMIPLARSWQYAPSVSITSPGFTGGSYDKVERAYKFLRTDPQAASLEFTLQGSSTSPVLNPCFVIEDWDNYNASLTINGQPVTPGSDFRQGIEMASDEVPSLVVWVRQDTTSPIDLVIGEVADANDFTPPVPDPMDWATLPYATSSSSISMTAATATDPSGVQYYFECTAGGGNSSGWQNDATYQDTGLSPSTQYTYRVR
ncbi:MAG: Calx-beta domain-containing protein, partial [Planctomycetota bacterium]